MGRRNWAVGSQWGRMSRGVGCCGVYYCHVQCQPVPGSGRSSSGKCKSCWGYSHSLKTRSIPLLRVGVEAIPGLPPCVLTQHLPPCLFMCPHSPFCSASLLTDPYSPLPGFGFGTEPAVRPAVFCPSPPPWLWESGFTGSFALGLLLLARACPWAGPALCRCGRSGLV